MGDMEFLTKLLADGIENEQFLSSIGQLKHVRRLSLRGYSSTPPSCSLISAGVSNLKRWLPTPFIEWISVKRLKLSNSGLSDHATNSVDFSGLSALEYLDLNGNKFSSLPSGLGFLPKLSKLHVRACKYLVSIPDLPSSLLYLFATDCKSLKRVRIPSEPKKELFIRLDNSYSLEEFQGIEDLSNCLWSIDVDDRSHSSSKLLKSVAEVMCNGRHGYLFRIRHIPSEMPNWMSYRGEGCSLSFHIPPVFRGLVLWFDKDDKDTSVKIIIRNNSNGIRLFKCTQWYYHPKTGFIRYISRSKMAMEDYCADDELELSIYSRQWENRMRNDDSCQPADIKECGVHVIAGKSDSFEELAMRTDTVMPSPPLYHLLPHPHCGSITTSTPKQWSDFLFAKLQNHNLSSTLWGPEDFD